ncbi:hypothetical protein HDU97_006488 [Phlyctochytrium planicorne]|nr:hypothetical protein HDU97_006488 [Phlyctochytrium planicorne]
MQGDDPKSGVSVVLDYDPAQQLITIRHPESHEIKWTRRQLRENVLASLRKAMAAQRFHPHRMIYAWTGRVFVTSAPKPIGGKVRIAVFYLQEALLYSFQLIKVSPGFQNYTGETADDLLEWIMEKAIDPPLGGRGRRKEDPGTVMRFVVSKINEILGLLSRKEKDAMDDAVLKGLVRAGHFEQSGRLMLPVYLREDYVYDGSGKSGKDTMPANGKARSNRGDDSVGGPSESRKRVRRDSGSSQVQTLPAQHQQQNPYQNPNFWPPFGPYSVGRPWASSYSMPYPNMPQTQPFHPSMSTPPTQSHPSHPSIPPPPIATASSRYPFGNPMDAINKYPSSYYTPYASQPIATALRHQQQQKQQQQHKQQQQQQSTSNISPMPQQSSLPGSLMAQVKINVSSSMAVPGSPGSAPSSPSQPESAYELADDDGGAEDDGEEE